MSIKSDTESGSVVSLLSLIPSVKSSRLIDLDRALSITSQLSYKCIYSPHIYDLLLSGNDHSIKSVTKAFYCLSFFISFFLSAVFDYLIPGQLCNRPFHFGQHHFVAYLYLYHSHRQSVAADFAHWFTWANQVNTHSLGVHPSSPGKYIITYIMTPPPLLSLSLPASIPTPVDGYNTQSANRYGLKWVKYVWTYGMYIAKSILHFSVAAVVVAMLITISQVNVVLYLCPMMIGETAIRRSCLVSAACTWPGSHSIVVVYYRPSKTQFKSLITWRMLIHPPSLQVATHLGISCSGGWEPSSQLVIEGQRDRDYR